jgi:hypothetical protein
MIDQSNGLGDEDQPEVLRITSRSATPVPVKQVTLFELDGIAYTVPAELPPKVGIDYLRQVRLNGRDVAIVGLLDDVLGAAAVDALLVANIEPDEMTALQSAVERHVTGVLEGKVPQRSKHANGRSPASARSGG